MTSCSHVAGPARCADRTPGCAFVGRLRFDFGGRLPPAMRRCGGTSSHVRLLWIPAFAGMTVSVGGNDKCDCPCVMRKNDSA